MPMGGQVLTRYLFFFYYSYSIKRKQIDRFSEGVALGWA